MIVEFSVQCWVGVAESCTVADLNDRGIRAIRRLPATRSIDKSGACVVNFPDRTRLDLRPAPVFDLVSNDRDRPVYQPFVLQDRPETVACAGAILLEVWSKLS